MTEYTKKTCEACRADAPKATDEQIQNFLSNYSEWKLIKEEENETFYKIAMKYETLFD